MSYFRNTDKQENKIKENKDNREWFNASSSISQNKYNLGSRTYTNDTNVSKLSKKKRKKQKSKESNRLKNKTT